MLTFDTGFNFQRLQGCQSIMRATIEKKRKQELATISKDINSSLASGSIAIDFHSALRPLKECRAQQSGQCLLTNMETVSFLKANIKTLLN